MKNHRLFMHVLPLILTAVVLLPMTPLAAQSPTAVTGAVTSIGSTTATLNGTVNANGISAVVYFEYGPDTGYGYTWAAVQSPVTGSVGTAVSASISELQLNTTYHYRVVATNTSGTAYGSDMTFTTQLPPPSVLTNPATAVTTNSAVLNGQVNPSGSETTVHFEYGTSAGYGSTIVSVLSPIATNLNSSWPATATLTGLTDGVTYHYRVAATNAGGTSYGQDMTFTPGGGSAPMATTAVATGVDVVSATLNGIVNAGSQTTTVTFEYGLTTAYGVIVTASPSPVAGIVNTPVSRAIGELTANTTYHYRVVATNDSGTTNGADMTFTTLPPAPAAETAGASGIGTTTATLNGTVNANGTSTVVTFEYGPTMAYGVTVTADQNPISGNIDTAVSKAISGLNHGVTYHFRVIAVSAGGTTYGQDRTFTTGAVPPTAVTNVATGVASTTATLNGSVNANGFGSTVSFQYGESIAYDRTVAAVPSTVTGSADAIVSLNLSSLQPGVTYHFRVMAENDGGVAYGGDMTFTTQAAPIVTTDVASGVSTSGATLNGTANANGLNSAITFQYGLTTAYGTTVTADQSPVTGSTDTAVSKTITGLTPYTTYHYRVVGQNAHGTTFGADQAFSTFVNATPGVETRPATEVLRNQVTLNGLVTPNNSSTVVTFEYGLTTAYGTTVTADQSPLSSGVDVPVSKTITGLADNTTYHFRIKGENAVGWATSVDMTFTTSSDPLVTVQPASDILSTSATLNGVVNANGNDCNVLFEYGTTTTYGTFGTAVPGSASGTADTQVSGSITGLTANQTYHFRIRLFFASTFVVSEDMTFTTMQNPTVVTEAPTGVGTNGVTLNGTLNAAGNTVNAAFEYGETLAYGKTIYADQSPVSGTIDTAISSILSSLRPNTTYHFRASAWIDGDVPVTGADMTFTTGTLPPTADTGAATAVTTSGATLNGAVNPQNDSTTVIFQYGLTPAYGTTVTAAESPVTGNAVNHVSAVLTGLTSDTTYHYRVVAQNGSGTTNGGDMTFYTGGGLPVAVTGEASGVNSSGATLNGTVNAAGASTTVTFQFGETAAYGRETAASPATVTGNTDTAVQAALSGLNSSTTYHYRVVAVNNVGTRVGADHTFVTTASGVAEVTTATVTDINSTSAVGGGAVGNEGAAPVTSRGICWSTGPVPTVADSHAGAGSGAGTFSVGIADLSPETTYSVRAFAVNMYGTSYGETVTFTTNPTHTPTVNTFRVTEITADSAVCGGNVVENGGSPVTSRGVCWSTGPRPTTANNRTVNGRGNGGFSSTLTGLSPATTYYARAYATNGAGTAYGTERQFTTLSGPRVSIISPADGAMVGGIVTVTAMVESDSQIRRVDFLLDGEMIGAGIPGSLSRGPQHFDLDGAAFLLRDDGGMLMKLDDRGDVRPVTDPDLRVTAMASSPGGSVFFALLNHRTLKDGRAYRLLSVEPGTGTVRGVSTQGRLVYTGCVTSPALQFDGWGRLVFPVAEHDGNILFMRRQSDNSVSSLMRISGGATAWRVLPDGTLVVADRSGMLFILSPGSRVTQLAPTTAVNWIVPLGENQALIGAGSSVLRVTAQGETRHEGGLSAELALDVACLLPMEGGPVFAGRRGGREVLLRLDPRDGSIVEMAGPGVAVRQLRAGRDGNLYWMVHDGFGPGTLLGSINLTQWPEYGTPTRCPGGFSDFIPLGDSGTSPTSPASVAYSLEWDTTLHESGIHRLQAVAVDENFLNGRAEIQVDIPDMVISLDVAVETERAWIIRRSFANLIVGLDNPQGILVTRFVILRSDGGSGFVEIHEFVPADLDNGEYAYSDTYLERGTAYTYRVEALTADGSLLAASPEVAVTLE